jgi:hypothetical protein
MKLLLRRSVLLFVHCPATNRCAFLFFMMLLFANKKANASLQLADKIITVKVNTAGIISVGRDTISSDDLALYIRERLFKSYTGTGKMYDGIKLVKDGEPENVVFEIVRKEIINGQKKALNELCLERYKRVFENISSRQQEKLKKNFPVLFQTTYD